MSRAQPIDPGIVRKLMEFRELRNPRTELICQGRAFREGKWLAWTPVSATVYENRQQWPRTDYEVRIAKAYPSVASVIVGEEK